LMRSALAVPHCSVPSLGTTAQVNIAFFHPCLALR
jgi:hypothetical protein